MSHILVLVAVICLALASACGGLLDATHNPGGNSAPVVEDLTVATYSGVAVYGTLHATDADDDALIFSITTAPTLGEVELLDAAAGTFRYNPVASALGSDQFRFKVSDGAAESAAGTVTVVISEVPPEGDGSFRVLAGVVTYDYVPAVCQGSSRCELDYTSTQARPIRGAVVRLVDAADTSRVLERTATDGNGAYSIRYSSADPANVRIIVLAQTTTPPIVVEDNTNGDAVFALTSAAFNADATPLKDLHAASGWDGLTYAETRAAGPFAILDSAYSAAKAFLAVRTLTFAPLRINWSENNRPESGSVATGRIGTSYWDGSELYILGKADTDTDEYDSHVIIHEWGHYFETELSRSDSVGGSHSFGDIVDPRVAFGEGWGNAVGSIVLYPDSAYVDTAGVDQAQGFSFDLENNALDYQPGWFSEAAVQSILYDLFDADSDAGGWDTVSLGLGPLADVLVGPQRDTPALTTIFSFIAALKQAHPAETRAAIDVLTAKHQISAVADAYGSGETNNAGGTFPLPIYRSVLVNQGNITLTLGGSSNPARYFNRLAANRYLRFTGDGGAVRVTVTANTDADIYVYASGTMAGAGYQGCAAPPCSESVDLSTTRGAEYIVNVQGFHGVDENYDVTVNISR